MDAAEAQDAGVGGHQQQLSGAAAAPRVERLNSEVHNQLNLEGMRARAVGLYNAISRILEDFDAIARANPNASPNWQDVLGQFSMVSMELFNIVGDINNVNKGFVVYPKNVNAENSAILPVMLSSKLLRWKSRKLQRGNSCVWDNKSISAFANRQVKDSDNDDWKCV